MVEANKMKSATNEGPQAKSNEGPLVPRKSNSGPLMFRRLSSQSSESTASAKNPKNGQLNSQSTESNPSVKNPQNRRLSSQSTESSASVKASKRSSLGQPRRPSVAQTSKKVDLKKTNSFVNALCKTTTNKPDKGDAGDFLEEKTATDEVLEKSIAGTKNEVSESNSFLENEKNRFQLVNALEALLAQPPKNVNSKKDQVIVKTDPINSDPSSIKSKEDPSKCKEEAKSRATDNISTTKSAKARATSTKNPTSRSRQTEPALNSSIQTKTNISTTDELLAVTKKSASRHSTGSVTKSSKCPAKPNRASLSPKKSLSVTKSSKVSSLPKSSSSKPIRTSTPKDSFSVRSTRTPSEASKEASSGSTPELKNAISSGKSSLQTAMKKGSSLHAVPQKGSMEELNSKIAISNKTLSMPDLFNIRQTDSVKSRSTPSKGTKLVENNVLEMVQQKFGLKLDGVTAKNKTALAKIMEQVEGIEHSLMLENQAKEDELQRQIDELEQQKMANEQLKKNNEILENCQQKIKDTMADREEEMMREIIAKNGQIEELKIFSMKNTDFLNGRISLKDEEALELNENIEKLKVILGEKDILLQDAFDQQAVYQEKIKEYENSDRLKDELMDDMMINHKNEIEALGHKMSDKDRIAKDLKLKVSKLIAEFTKEFKEKDEEIKTKTEKLKFKTKEATNALAENKVLQDDLVKIKKALSDKIKDLEEGNGLKSTIIENLNEQINQQSIVIENLTKDYSELKDEVTKIEHDKLSSNLHVSDTSKSENSEVSVQTEMEFERNCSMCLYEPKNYILEFTSQDVNEALLDCGENYDEILMDKKDNPIQEQENDDEETKNAAIKSGEQTIHNTKEETIITNIVSDDNLGQKIQIELTTTGDVKQLVKQFESISKAGIDLKSEENLKQTLEPSQDTIPEVKTDLKPIPKDQTSEMKPSFESSGVQLEEAHADESSSQINFTDMVAEMEINIIKTSELNNLSGFDIPKDETSESSREISVQVLADKSLNQTSGEIKTYLDVNTIQTLENVELLESVDQAKIDVNVILNSGDDQQKEHNTQVSFDWPKEDNEAKSTLEQYEVRMVEVQTDIEALGDLGHLESNSQEVFNMDVMLSSTINKDAEVETQMDETVNKDTDETMWEKNQTDGETKLESKLNQTLGYENKLKSNIQDGFGIKLDENTVFKQSYETSKNLIVKVEVDNISNQANEKPKVEAQTDDNVNLSKETNMKLVQSTEDLELSESHNHGIFDMKLKEKNRQIITQTFEPIKDIIVEVSKHTKFEDAPKVEDFSTLTENDGFDDGFETENSKTKNWQSPMNFRRSYDSSSHSLAVFDVTLNILENKRSLKKKRKEFSPFSDTEHGEERREEHGDTADDVLDHEHVEFGDAQDDFVDHVLNLKNITIHEEEGGEDHGDTSDDFVDHVEM